MGHVREIVQQYFHSERIPWEWNDPRARLAAGLAIPVVALLVAKIWLDVPQAWFWTAIGFSLAATFHRNVQYIRRTGQFAKYLGMYRGLSIVWLGLALINLLISVVTLSVM